MEDVIAVFEQEIGYDSTQLGIITPTYEIFSKSKSLSDEAIMVLQIFAGSLLRNFGYDSTQQVGNILPKGGYDSTHSKKKEKEDEEKILGGEAPYNKGVNESEVENDDVNVNDDELPSYETRRRRIVRTPKVTYPYFNSQEISQIISNFNVASEREDKLFIHILWRYLQDHFTEKDKDGNEILNNMQDEMLPSEDVAKEIGYALESTNDAIDDGYYKIDDDKKPPVDLKTHLEVESVKKIIGFEHESIDRKVYCIISQDKFYNIYAKPVEVASKERVSRRRAENVDDTNREQQREYFRQLLLSYYDDRYDNLSEIEAAIVQFSQAFFEIDKQTGEILSIKEKDELNERKYLSSTEYRSFIEKVRTKKNINITQKDFESVLNNMSVDLNENLTPLSESMVAMFSYQKIQEWNQINNQNNQ